MKGFAEHHGGEGKGAVRQSEKRRRKGRSSFRRESERFEKPSLGDGFSIQVGSSDQQQFVAQRVENANTFFVGVLTMAKQGQDAGAKPLAQKSLNRLPRRRAKGAGVRVIAVLASRRGMAVPLWTVAGDS